MVGDVRGMEFNIGAPTSIQVFANMFGSISRHNTHTHTHPRYRMSLSLRWRMLLFIDMLTCLQNSNMPLPCRTCFCKGHDDCVRESPPCDREIMDLRGTVSCLLGPA
jgi:hypothetical protein